MSVRHWKALLKKLHEERMGIEIDKTLEIFAFRVPLC